MKPAFSLANIRRGAIGTLILTGLYLFMGCLLDRPFFVPFLKTLATSRGGELRNIEETITLYNKVLTDIYVSDGQVLRLDDLPVRTGLKHEIYRELDFLRAKNLVMIYDQAAARFVTGRLTTPYSADVTVYEEWNYVYRQGEERKQASAVKGMGSGYRYHLIRHQGKWMIADVEPVTMKRPEGKDEFRY